MKIKIDGKEYDIKAEDIIEMTAGDIPQTLITEIGGLTDTKVKEYLQTEKGKTLIQPELDRAVTKGLQTWQDNNIDKIKASAIEDMKAETTKKLGELEGKYKELQVTDKFKSSLLKQGLRQDKVDLALKLADISKLQLDGDTLIGANDMAESLKAQTPEWFGVQEKPKGTGNASNPLNATPPGTTTTDTGLEAFKNAAGLT